MDITIILLRFGLVFFLALLFGLERQMSHKPIGFGTFTFVSLGACGLAITAADFGKQNPIPLLSAIVTGIGFLGAGALIRTPDKIFGFTTAASIWAFSIFGLIIGVGEYFTGIMVYALIWAVVLIDKFFENRSIGLYQKKFQLVTSRIVHKDEVLLMFGDKKWKFVSISTDKKKRKSTMFYLVEGSREEMYDIQQKLLKQKWIESFKME